MRKLNKGLHLASLSVLALAVLLGAQGCGKKANGPSALGINPTYETIIPATTKVADTATAESLSAISPDATTLTFASTTSLLDSLATGDVLVFGVTEKTPFGLLRKVESVAKNAGEVVVTTSEARLTDAIQQGSINLQRTLHADEVVDFEPLVDGVSFEKSTSAFLGVSVPLHNVLIKDLDGNLSTTNDQATISGSFDLAPHLDIEIDIDIKEFEIEDCYLDVALGETLDLQVAAGAEMPISEELPIANVTFGTYVVFAGPIPIVLTPKATVSLFIEGNVSEGMNVGLTQKMLVNSKIGLIDEKWRVDKGFGNTFTIHPPEIFTSASFETGAKAQLALLLYGSFGPYGEFDASLKFGADINVNPWWWLDGCAEVNLGFSFKILSWSVADYHANIYQGCSRLLEAEGGFTGGGGGNGGGGNGGGGNGGGTTGDYWAKTFGNLDPIFGDDLSDTGYVVDNAPNGGYYVGGWTGLDAWVIRLDGDGNITWEKMLTGGGAFWPNTGTATADGGFILAGRDGFGAWLAKFNSDGSLAWQKRYNFEGQNGEFFGIIQTSDGGYALAGWSLYYNLSFHSSFLMKLSADGNAQWIRNFNNVNGASAKSVSEAPNGDLLVAGDSGVNGWVARVSAGGTVIWERSYSFPDAGNTDILSVWANRHGGFVVIGDASLEGNFIAGVQDDGTPAWAVKYNFTYPGANGEIIESLNSIRQTDDGGYIVAGSLVPYGGTDHDYLVVRFNPGGGSAVWTKRIVGSEEDEALCAVPADGGFIAVGQAKLPTSGTWTDILVTKFKSDGSINFNPSSALQLGEVSVQKAVVQLYKGEVTTVVTPPQVTIQDSSANIAQTNAVVTSLAP